VEGFKYFSAARGFDPLRKHTSINQYLYSSYCPIHYRLLVGHQKLDQEFGEELVDQMMRYFKT
jgi:hypothetical protein